MEPNQIMLGKYSMPFILSIILGLVYKRAEISDDLKPYIAMVVGVGIGVAAMFYNEAYAAINFPIIADYILAGGMAGSAAVGIYEMRKESPAGRTYVAIDSAGKKIAGARVAKMSKIKVMK